MLYLLTVYALLVKAEVICSSFCPRFGNFGFDNPVFSKATEASSEIFKHSEKITRAG